MVASASAQLLASSTLPSYMMRSPAVNPMIVSKCSASRVQVDAVTCVGRECGGLYLGLGHLSRFRWRGWRWRRQGRAVKRSRTGMRGSYVGRCRRNQQQYAPNSHLSIRIYLHQHRMPLPFLPQLFTTEPMDMGIVDAGLVAMESVWGRGEPPRVCSFLRSLSNLSLLIDQKEGAESK